MAVVHTCLSDDFFCILHAEILGKKGGKKKENTRQLTLLEIFYLPLQGFCSKVSHQTYDYNVSCVFLCFSSWLQNTHLAFDNRKHRGQKQITRTSWFRLQPPFTQDSFTSKRNGPWITGLLADSLCPAVFGVTCHSTHTKSYISNQNGQTYARS